MKAIKKIILALFFLVPLFSFANLRHQIFDITGKEDGVTHAIVLQFANGKDLKTDFCCYDYIPTYGDYEEWKLWFRQPNNEWCLMCPATTDVFSPVGPNTYQGICNEIKSYGIWATWEYHPTKGGCIYILKDDVLGTPVVV